VAEQGDQEDRTEDPSPRRLSQAIEKGDVARSSEVSTFFLLSAATLSIMIVATTGSLHLALSLRSLLANMHEIPVDGQGLRNLAQHSLQLGLGVVALPFLLMVLASIGGNMIQHSPVWSAESLMPKLSRLSPLAGFKRLFSLQSVVQLGKGFAKMLVVGVALVAVTWPERQKLGSFVQLDIAAVLPLVLVLVLKLLGTTLAIFFFIAGADYAYQRATWMKRQRMTKQEVKEEFKEMEGNPEIKNKIRQMRSQVARKRMMASVPKATVIITNPTHYAVALRYESGMQAPICVAKGLDSLALKIREIAEENEVPIMENRPLARALYVTVAIDDEIPAEHYKAVAEVIGYVMRFRKRRI
jgi:flagellar biosynthetic protein FlhB